MRDAIHIIAPNNIHLDQLAHVASTYANLKPDVAVQETLFTAP